MVMKNVIEAVKGTLPEAKDGQPMKNYSLSKRLRAVGCDITPQGLDLYSAGTKSCRIDVLCALQELSGLSWAEIGKLLKKDAKASQ